MLNFMKYMYFKMTLKDDFRCTAIVSLGVTGNDAYRLRGIIADGNGDLAFSDKADLKRFARLTANTDCIVGANTLKTMGHVRNNGRRWILPNGDYERYRELLKEECISDEIKENLWVIHDGDTSYHDWKDLELDIMRSEVYAIGGPNTYRRLYEHIDIVDATCWNTSLQKDLSKLQNAQHFEFGPFETSYRTGWDSFPIHGYESNSDPLAQMDCTIPQFDIMQFRVFPKKGLYKNGVKKTNVIRRVK